MSKLKRNLGALIVAAPFAVASGFVHAADAAKGEELAQTCAVCHGADGNSTIAANPILAGQYESYLVRALRDYRSGSRQNAIMAGFAAGLSDQDIRDLAKWFSSQESDLAVLKK